MICNNSLINMNLGKASFKKYRFLMKFFHIRGVGVGGGQLVFITLREATPYHFSCFFIKLIKGGGVIPVYKNLCCGFYIFWRALAT